MLDRRDAGAAGTSACASSLAEEILGCVLPCRPDKWFDNVEIVTAGKIGIETTTDVRNIFKYFTSCKLTVQAQRERERAMQQMPTK